MAKLVINSGGAQNRTLELRPGTNRVGRASTNEFQLDDPSVSSAHCEIVQSDQSVLVKDLGSTNGTFIDGEPIQEARLEPGQTLRLGTLEMVLDPPRQRIAIRLARAAEPEAAAAPPEIPLAPPVPYVSGAAPPPFSSGSAFCKFHRKSAAHWRCGKCGQSFCDLCVTFRAGGEGSGKYCRTCAVECEALEVALEIAEEKSFFAQLPEVFSYPFRKNGWMLLIGGTLVYLVWRLATHFFMLRVSGLFSLLLIAGELCIYTLMVGYVCAYMQKIMVYSGQGEQALPGWPDVTEMWSDVIVPFLLFVGTILICIAPALACLVFGGDSLKSASIALAILGAFYFPMALLAVGMSDNILAVNPLVIIPSILKIFPIYLVVFFFMGCLVTIRALGDWLVNRLPVPVVPFIITGFLALYFLTVQMRVLGLMYYCNREQLGWFKRS